jgi:predicted RNA-binding protein with PIN domain
VRWLVDGNNVMGSRPDGWWNNREAAAARLTQRIAEWCRTHGDPVIVVFDGRPDDAISQLSGGNLAVEFAARAGRNAADDRIVDLVDEMFVDPDLTVVTADRGLMARLPAGVHVEGPGSFLGRLTTNRQS